MSATTLHLWNIAASRANLTQEELEQFSGVTGDGYIASCVADVVTGIGCLVDSDTGKKDGKAGNFQGGDTLELMTVLAELLNEISAREHIASEAAHLLRDRFFVPIDLAKKSSRHQSP